MIISKISLPRRTLLRGLGVTLALPFLDAMVPALSAAPKRPRRLGFFYSPMGQNKLAWLPTGEGKNFEFGTTMTNAGLNKFKDKSVVVTGLFSRGAESVGDGGGIHTRAVAAWLSGAKAKKTDVNPVLGKTADSYAADAWQNETLLPSFELTLEDPGGSRTCDQGYTCTYKSTISWSSPTSPNPMEQSPRQAFERLFGEGGTPEQRRAGLTTQTSVLDLVNEQINQLTKRLGGQDRSMMSDYVEGVRAIEQRIQRAEAQASSVPLAMGRPMSVPDSYDDYATLMYDLLALAYQADMTRVATFMIGVEGGGAFVGGFPQLGISESHHIVSHHQNDPENLRKLAKINTYHMSFWVKFLERLQSMPEGDYTVLDNSTLVYGAGMSDPDPHDCANIPAVLVGGASGALKGGRHVAYDVPTRTPLGNLWLTTLAMNGVNVDHVGESNGRLLEIL